MVSLLSHQATIFFILLLSFHIGLSLSSSVTTSTSPSLFQSQKAKTSARKLLLSSIDEGEKLPGPKSPKKKPISEEKEENFVTSSKPLKKKLVLEEKFQKPISSSKPRKKLTLEEATEELTTNSKLSKKKPVLEEKLDKLTKRSKKKLDLKEEVEKLLSSSDPKPLKKKTIAELKDQKNEIKPIKSTKSNSTASAVPTKIKLSKLDTTTSYNKISKSVISTNTPISKTKKKQPINQATEDVTKQKTLDHPISLLEDTDSDDMIADLPDLFERLSITSKAYITAANSGIAEGVRPFLGSKFANLVAPIASALFLVVPLLLLISLLKRLGSCLSLVRHLLVFIQAYLAIYFATLTVTALVTGLEPLRFFYATSPSSYTWTQV
jgi:hypothetical protein